MAQEKEKPLTREDVLRLIEENGGTAKGLDLSGKVFEEDIDLHEFDLRGIILKGARLWRANLKGASLWDAKLEGADLVRANLERAKLRGANLEGANLVAAKLEGAYLLGATFSFDTRLDGVDWGRDGVCGEEKEKHFGEAEKVYHRLERWHEQHGIRDLASDFAYKKHRARRKALGAEMRQKFKEALRRFKEAIKR